MQWPPFDDSQQFADPERRRSLQAERVTLTFAERATFDELGRGYWGRRRPARLVRRILCRTRAGAVAFALEWVVVVVGALTALAIEAGSPIAIAGVAALTAGLVALLRECRHHGVLSAGGRRRHQRDASSHSGG